MLLFRKKDMRSAWILIAMFPLLTGCFSAHPVAKMEPANSDFKWSHGQKLLEESSEGFTVSLAYNRSTSKYLIFDVEISNHSNRNVLVAPETFYYSCHNQYGTALGQKYYALNPEEQLLRIDQMLSKNEAGQTSPAGFSMLSASTEALALIASTGNAPMAQSGIASENVLNRYHRNDTEERSTESHETLRQQRNYWARMTLRKTSLKPGFYIGGKVYFPKNNAAARCYFTFPLSNTQVVFEYQQHLIAP